MRQIREVPQQLRERTEGDIWGDWRKGGPLSFVSVSERSLEEMVEVSRWSDWGSEAESEVDVSGGCCWREKQSDCLRTPIGRLIPRDDDDGDGLVGGGDWESAGSDRTSDLFDDSPIVLDYRRIRGTKTPSIFSAGSRPELDSPTLRCSYRVMSKSMHPALVGFAGVVSIGDAADMVELDAIREEEVVGAERCKTASATSKPEANAARQEDKEEENLESSSLFNSDLERRISAWLQDSAHPSERAFNVWRERDDEDRRHESAAAWVFDSKQFCSGKGFALRDEYGAAFGANVCMATGEYDVSVETGNGHIVAISAS
ncbi:MAG: hypothetical protein Q9190_001685 [Brigantiaea leucoxantha]